MKTQNCLIIQLFKNFKIFNNKIKIMNKFNKKINLLVICLIYQNKILRIQKII